MKIIFFGSSDFAVPALEALKGKEGVELVVTRPDRRKGRSLKISATPVKDTAARLNIKIAQPEDINSRDSIGYLKKFNADLFVVVSFGQILRREVLDIPKLYSINVHASVLPKYRGAAPINWAIANGEKETGITIIKMNEGMDEGEIVLKEAVSIGMDEDAIELSQRLSKKGALALLDSIDLIKRDAVSFLKQPDNEATYAPKLKKEDGLIDWRWGAEEIYNRIRAFVPWPGAFTYWDKKILKICRARPDNNHGTADSKPGTVLELGKAGILAGTGKGVLRIEELQLEGKRCMKAGEFVLGHKEMASGAVFSLQK